MKALKLVCLLWLLIGFQNCSEEENIQKEQLQFTFEFTTDTPDGGRISSDLPDDAKVLISIESSTGSPLFTFHEVEILRIGNGLITLPLEIIPGAYKVTDFLVVNDDEALYSTPKEGSPLASFITRPLDIDFTVRSNKITNIEMEVIDVTQYAPEDFGYTSFHINIVNPLSISVFRPKSNTLQLTSAKAYILQGDDTLQYFNLGARINTVGFKQDKNETYTLMIVKSGHTLYKEEFIYSDLVDQLGGQTLKVILTPAVTMLANAGYFGEFTFRVEGGAGSVTVNWGDGTSGDYTLNSGDPMEHTYPGSGNYFISITGDLTDIKNFYAFYDDGNMDEINLDLLTELREIRLGLLSRSPRVVSLVNSTKLESVYMPWLTNTEIINLPVVNNINYVFISGPNKLTTTSISEIIDRVYQTAKTNFTFEGRFEFTENAHEPEGGMVVTPTPEALDKLMELRDLYGWTIVPDL